mgnify:CR=1 FL=1
MSLMGQTRATQPNLLAVLMEIGPQPVLTSAAVQVWPEHLPPPRAIASLRKVIARLEALDADPDGEKPLSKPEQTKPQQLPWPATLPEQVRAVAAVLAASPAPLTLPAIESRFKGRGPWKKSLPTLLQTLEALGRAQAVATDGEVAWRG